MSEGEKKISEREHIEGQWDHQHVAQKTLFFLVWMLSLHRGSTVLPVQKYLLLFSCSVLSDSLPSHGLHTSSLWHSDFLMVQLSHPYMTTWKTIALTLSTFVGKVTSLLFNTLYRFVIAFLPRSMYLLISWLQSLSAVILEPKNIVCYCFHCFPIYFPWSDGTECHDLCFLNVEF